jgi:hypothetical protein
MTYSLKIIKPALFKIDSKKIYVAILAAALILSYVRGQDQNAALIYYGSFVFLFAYIIGNKSYLRPGYLFLFMLNPYVAVGTVGLWIEIQDIFPVFPFFGTEEFLAFFRVGLVALLGVALPLAWERTPNLTPRNDLTPKSKSSFNVVLLLFIFVALAGNFAYAYSHREMFIDSYVFNVQGFGELQHMPIVYLNLLIFGLTMMYIVFEPKWTNSRSFWIIVGIFTLFCVKVGMRTPLVIYLLMLFWRYYAQHGLRLLDNFLVKLAGLSAAIILLGAINAYREGHVNFISAVREGYTSLIFEFGFAIISGLHSVRHVLSGDKPPLLLGLLDPLWGTIPTFLLPWKRDMLTFRAWIETVGGGSDFFSPVGGFFTPGNLYLITGSLLGVFIYFSLFSMLLIWGYRNLFRDKPLPLLRALPAVSMILIIGLREEYWVIVKTIILWVWLIPLLAYRISRLFLTGGRSKGLIPNGEISFF